MPRKATRWGSRRAPVHAERHTAPRPASEHASRRKLYTRQAPGLCDSASSTCAIPGRGSGLGGVGVGRARVRWLARIGRFTTASKTKIGQLLSSRRARLCRQFRRHLLSMGSGLSTAEPISRKPCDDPSGDDGMSNSSLWFKVHRHAARGSPSHTPIQVECGRASS
jgi:hypothetical protein